MQLDLIIAEWNANGITSHVNEISMFLELYTIDVFLICETHLTSKSYLNIKGYDAIISNHPDDRAHGGAAILIRRGLRYEICDNVAENYLQAAGVKIKLQNNTSISIFSAYISHRFNKDALLMNGFLKTSAANLSLVAILTPNTPGGDPV